MSLRVLLVDDERERAMLVKTALEAEGFTVAAVLAAGAFLPERLAVLEADVIIVDIDSPDRDVLEDMRIVAHHHQRPVVMFAQDGSLATIRAAVEAGVSAYVVDGLKAGRVRPVVDVAIAHFRRFQQVKGELDKTKAMLAERKRIDRAKGILMRSRGCDEDQAYRSMRKMAMDGKCKLADIAAKIIAAAELLG
jgi:two-component system, response regulator / RNA-binding antiterminator